MYSNIPVTETKQITEDIMEHNLTDISNKTKLLNWYAVTPKQNYFINNNDLIIQNDGLAMGAPSSSIIAEMFLQHTENSHFAPLAQNHKNNKLFSMCRRYLFDLRSKLHKHTAILNDFNAIHPKLHFTAEIEQNNTLLRHIHPQNSH